MTKPTEAFEHWCEVCGKSEVLTSEEAYRTGWDFPPRMGQWGVISPRTCRTCPMNRTVWWAIQMDNYDAKQLVRAIVHTNPDGPESRRLRPLCILSYLFE